MSASRCSESPCPSTLLITQPVVMTPSGEVVCAFMECKRRIGSAEWWFGEPEEERDREFLMVDKELFMLAGTLQVWSLSGREDL
jgi:hypothetical protein